MEKASKIFLINSQKQILLYLRDNKPRICYPEYWDIFGGAAEKNETPLESLKREIQEEIEQELEIFKPEFIGNIFFKKDKLNLADADVSIFKGEIDLDIDKIKLNEGQRLKFFTFDKILKLKFPRPYIEFMVKNKDKLFL